MREEASALVRYIAAIYYVLVLQPGVYRFLYLKQMRIMVNSTHLSLICDGLIISSPIIFKW